MNYIARQFDANGKWVKTLPLDDIVSFSEELDRRWLFADCDFGTNPMTFRCYKNGAAFDYDLPSERYEVYDQRSALYDLYAKEVRQ